MRNKLDLADAKQVRLVKKRLRLSEAELAQIVEKIGNSIGAISKQVQRARQLPEPEQLLVATVAASASAATKTTISAEPVA
jgi:hypothetical protein